MQNLPLRVLAAIALIAIFGSALYYAAPVTILGLLIVCTLAIVLAYKIPLQQSHGASSAASITSLSSFSGEAGSGFAGHFSLLTAIIALCAWWNVILHVTIIDAVRSPWNVVDPFVIAALGIALLCCIMLFVGHRTPCIAIALFIATLFSALSMAAVVYPLGFGFDPFLHRATITHIMEFGTITPKPLYYIGQYAVELVLSMLLRLPLTLVDHFLLPLFAALAIVPCILRMKQRSLVSLAAMFLLPLGVFIATTPQGLAYVFALCAIVLTTHGSRPNWLPWILGVASVVTHPFAGIPVLLYLAACEVMRRCSSTQQTARRITFIISGAAAACAIPLLFAAQALRSGLALQFHIANFFSLERWQGLALTGFFHNQFSIAYDGLYLVIDNMLAIVAVLGVIGFFVLRHHNTLNDRSRLQIVFAFGMFVNFLLLNIGFDFDFLISYERSDYALRALTLAQLFLFPLVFASIDAAAAIKKRALRVSVFVLLAFVGMANVYGAYPRHDNYARSAGFNVSQSDFNAVAAIANAGGDDAYIVLANQATSAAAVATHGFKTYYHGDIFYYPIPTGGPLYEKFLSMVNVAPTRATMYAAMDIAGVDKGFFAVSDYWWKSDTIIENAKREADDWFAVDDGAVTVFEFRR